MRFCEHSETNRLGDEYSFFILKTLLWMTYNNNFKWIYKYMLLEILTKHNFNNWCETIKFNQI